MTTSSIRTFRAVAIVVALSSAAYAYDYCSGPCDQAAADTYNAVMAQGAQAVATTCTGLAEPNLSQCRSAITAYFQTRATDAANQTRSSCLAACYAAPRP